MLSNFLHAKLCLFVFDSTSAASHCQFFGKLLAYVAALLVASFWGLQASVAEWLVRSFRG